MFCSPVVPVLTLHRRAHGLEGRLAAELPDIPQLDGLVLAIRDEVAPVAPKDVSISHSNLVLSCQYYFILTTFV